MRKVMLRLPKFLAPKPVPYGHIAAIDGNGRVVQNLHDPGGSYEKTTSVTETGDYLYVGSLVMPVMGRLKKTRVGL
jgi:hypothetical protein